jgi:hypothetical protein
VLLLPTSPYDAPNLFEAAQGIGCILLSCDLLELRTCSLSQLAASAQTPSMEAQIHPDKQRLTCKGFRCFRGWIIATRSENSVMEDKHCSGSRIKHDDDKVLSSSEPVTNSTSLAQEPGGTECREKGWLLLSTLLAHSGSF